MSLQLLKEMSNRYGSNPAYVLAGGGNTSYKDNEVMYVKGSGVSLAEITESGFVKMDRARLNNIFSSTYSSDPDTREAEVLRDMMAARCIGEENKRPSVEALLHNVLPFTFILHVHPSKGNGLTCSKSYVQAVSQLFPNNSITVGQIMPGYILAKDVKDKMESYEKEHGKLPTYIFLENHGVFIGGNSIEEIDAAVEQMDAAFDKKIVRNPDFSEVEYDKEFAVCAIPAVRILAAEGKVATFVTNKEVMNVVASRENFEKATPSFSPDHMVYCNDKALFIEASGIESFYTELEEKIKEYKAENNKLPKIIGLKNVGFFACGNDKKNADIAASLFLNAIEVSVYAESFGGGKPMKDELIYAINNWEVERYRRSVSATSGNGNRLRGKISIVTGSAQGFGLGIAKEMAKEGSYLAIADLNGDGAKAVAEELNKEFGKGTAIGLTVNVGDEENVKQMIYDMTLAYGGLDVFVNNAGIVKAGGLEEMQLNAFELVTKVNYTAYFLCTKYAAKIMKIQNRFTDEWTDIIQVNSKSGLEGSKRNFAYAGSKFGGIGLTESFALELVEDRIKVNSICPGNFLGGPLWMDPEKGLFVQYLKAGKVPGAKTVEDVKKFYEAKVPMNRGCETIDVARAIFYAVEQDYETGQAIPVTGGQIMLN
ncbi:MAG: SDR family NAD(P)-dependent oxidoreductase [Ruminococcaceae bacterium]|nr:SDR family NAD(P)-dependent oxidoreductase [Oscillospiraceae bacterium]